MLQKCQFKVHNVDQLFVEYHNFINQPQYLGEILELLKNAGFKYFISNPGIHQINSLVKSSEYLGMDFQINIHARKI